MNETVQIHKIRQNINDVDPSTIWILLPFQNLFIYSCLYSLDFFSECLQNTELQTSPRKGVKTPDFLIYKVLYYFFFQLKIDYYQPPFYIRTVNFLIPV